MIGIDIGLNGGICLLDEQGDLIDLWKPKLREQAGKNEWDAYALANLLEELRHMEEVIYLEACGYHYKQSASMRSSAMCEGILVGVAATLGYDLVRIQATQWQKKVLGHVPKGMTKEYAVNYARSRWPKANWLRTKRCSKDDDGYVDAACIALYGLNQTRGIEL